MRKQRAQITEATFKAVKIMLAGGASCVEIAQYLKLGETAVYRIKKAEDWDEYRNILAAIAINKKEKCKAEKEPKPETIIIPKPPEVKQEQTVVEHRQTVTIQATHYMMEELKKQNELLAIISNKLAFIVDELTK